MERPTFGVENLDSTLCRHAYISLDSAVEEHAGACVVEEYNDIDFHPPPLKNIITCIFILL